MRIQLILINALGYFLSIAELIMETYTQPDDYTTIDYMYATFLNILTKIKSINSK